MSSGVMLTLLAVNYDRKTFKVGGYVAYRKSGRQEVMIGRVKTLLDSGAHVYYSSDGTITFNSYSELFPIANEDEIKKTTLGNMATASKNYGTISLTNTYYA